MTDMEDQVLSTMKVEGEPMKAAQIAEKLGVEKKEVDKAMKGLKKTGAISSPKNCFWEPSK
jgi:Mn-dependent DtxR family transcriptional regulator